MKKDKRTFAQKKASIKRGEKRTARLRKTQAEKPLRKAAILEAKKKQEMKFKEAMSKLMQARR